MAAQNDSRPEPTPVAETDAIDSASPRTEGAHPRNDPREWHRRGLRTPAELHKLVAARINALPRADRDLAAGDDTTDPTYGDFLKEPTA